MAYRNPYSEYARTGDEDSYRREALLDALNEPELPMTPRPRTPARPPEQTREMLAGPGGRTTYAPDIDTGNAFSGDVPDVYRPPDSSGTTASGTGTQTPAQTHTYNPQRGFQLMDEYDDPYTRRMEGSPGVGASAAKYASLGGSIVPGYGHVIGGLAGAIGALFAKNAETAMTDFAIDDARQIISQAHKDAFGRDIDPAYLDQIVRGQGWEPGDRWMGQDSLAYVLDAFAQQAPGERAAQAAANAAAAQQGTQQAGAQGALGDYAGNLEGFAMERFADPSGRGNNTVKYQVGRVLSRHAPNAEGLAAAAEELRGMGFDVQQGGRNGDLLEFGEGVVDDEGRRIGTIDVGRGFGAAGSGWAWQPQGGADGAGGVGGADGEAPADIQGAYAYLKSIAHPGMSRAEMESAVTRAFGNVPGFEKAYAGDVVINGRKIDLITNFEGANPQWSDNLSFVPLHGGGGAAVPAGGGLGGTSLANLAPGVQLAAPLGQSDVNRQIQEALQRLISGAPDRDALLAELGAG